MQPQRQGRDQDDHAGQQQPRSRAGVAQRIQRAVDEQRRHQHTRRETYRRAQEVVTPADVRGACHQADEAERRHRHDAQEDHGEHAALRDALAHPQRARTGQRAHAIAGEAQADFVQHRGAQRAAGQGVGETRPRADHQHGRSGQQIHWKNHQPRQHESQQGDGQGQRRGRKITCRCRQTVHIGPLPRRREPPHRQQAQQHHRHARRRQPACAARGGEVLGRLRNGGKFRFELAHRIGLQWIEMGHRPSWRREPPWPAVSLAAKSHAGLNAQT